MARIDIPFVVEKQHISQPTREKLVAGGKNYFYATFKVSDTWDDIPNIKAVFVRGDISKLIGLTKTDSGYECKIPWEVMVAKGVFCVGIFGGDTMLTDMEYVEVKQGCVTDGEEPLAPTPDWFSKMESELADKVDIRHNVDESNDYIYAIKPGSNEVIILPAVSIDKIKGIEGYEEIITDEPLVKYTPTGRIVCEDPEKPYHSVNMRYLDNTLDKCIAKIDGKVDKVDGKGLSSNDFTDEHAEQISTNATDIENLTNDVSTNTTDIENLTTEVSENVWGGIGDNQARIAVIESDLYQTPIESVPTTLTPNKQYNFGEVTELALAFPTVANDGDVIYATFITGETATALTIDTTNTCDIEFVPEAHTGYEVFGKFNGSIWIVNYSEYTVSEG